MVNGVVRELQARQQVSLRGDAAAVRFDVVATLVDVFPSPVQGNPAEGNRSFMKDLFELLKQRTSTEKYDEIRRLLHAWKNKVRPAACQKVTARVEKQGDLSR